MSIQALSIKKSLRILVFCAVLLAASAVAVAQGAGGASGVDRQGAPSDLAPMPMESLLEVAEDFLASPDSGVWAGPEDTFENAAAAFDISGHLSARYLRYHHGLQVLGASVKVTVDPISLEVTHNFPAKSFQAPENLEPRIQKDEAWELAAEHLRLDREGLFGETELMLEPRGEKPAALVWSIDAFHPDAAPRTLHLDAVSGEILWEEKGYVETSVDAVGTGFQRPASGETQPQPVELDTLLHDHDNRFFLVDHTRGGTKVLDMEDGVERVFFKGVEYSQVGNNDWGDGLDWQPGEDTRGVTGQTAAVEVFWGAQRTWDMLLNTRNIEGYDGLGSPMLLRVHYRKDKDELYDDANYDRKYANFGDLTPGSEWSNTQLGIVAHELGHGVWHRQVSKYNKGEARGLNEGHADIMAALASHYTHLADGVGSAIPTNEYGNLEYFFQRTVNPWSYHAEGQTGLAAYVVGMEHREEHCQGTAYGHMFAILAMGVPSQAEFDASPCTGRSFSCLAKSPFPLGLAGIGMERAGVIWREATVKYFDEDPTFHEVRSAYEKAAIDGFGPQSPEHLAVQNAFYLINVGDPAEDLGPPEIGPTPPIVDNAEGSVLIEAVAVDDIGVVEMSASTNTDWEKVRGDSIKTYLEAASMPGPTSATVKAIDGSLNWSQANLPFDYHSEDRLFLSDFESSVHIQDDSGVDEWRTGGWLVSTPSMIIDDRPERAFLGDGYISFANRRAMRHTVIVPEGTLSLELGFRYRVRPDLPQAAELRVEIRDEDDNILEAAPPITAADVTDQDFSNHYLKRTYTLSDSYAGQTLVVRIASVDAPNDAFSIDQVYMTYDAVHHAELEVEVDEREGSVILDAEFSGFSQDRIDSVKFFVDGVEFDEDNHWPYQLIRSPEFFTKDAMLQAMAVAYDHFGDEIASSAPVDFEVKTVVPLLFNGDFESGDSLWTLEDDVDLCHFNPAGGQSHTSFMGDGCMTFAGAGKLSRPFWIPGDALTASLSFRLHNDSPPGSGEVFIFRVINDNTDVELLSLPFGGPFIDSDLGISHAGFRKYIIDLTPFIGQDLRLEFESTFTGPPAHFTLDNVGALHYTFGGGGGPGEVTD